MISPGFDVAVIGGGIAGVTAAAHLSDRHTVVLLEQENELAYHTTSRSAAIFVESEGGPVFHRLSAASRSFFDEPPGADAPLLSPLPVLSVGTEKMATELEATAAESQAITPSIRFVEGDELVELCPILRPEVIAAGMLEPTAASIDVMATHQLFLRTARRRNTDVRRAARVTGMTRSHDRWRLDTDAGPVDAVTVVNAAGAWGDVVGSMAGAEPVGLTPRRRTAFTSPIEHDPSDWPFIYCGIPELTCYFKPEAGSQLLCSLSDETPSEPIDAKPEEVDIAMAIDHINTISTLDLRSVRTKWAGLRTFAPDRNPVFGWDDRVAGFFWLVGQGGCGILTSPAAGRITAGLIAGEGIPADIAALGLEESMLAPRRP